MRDLIEDAEYIRQNRGEVYRIQNDLKGVVFKVYMIAIKKACAEVIGLKWNKKNNKKHLYYNCKAIGFKAKSKDIC